jgi:hypothetical protein
MYGLGNWPRHTRGPGCVLAGGGETQDVRHMGTSEWTSVRLAHNGMLADTRCRTCAGHIWQRVYWTLWTSWSLAPSRCWRHRTGGGPFVPAAARPGALSPLDLPTRLEPEQPQNLSQRCHDVMGTMSHHRALQALHPVPRDRCAKSCNWGYVGQRN